MKIEEKLAQMGLTLPAPGPAAGNYLELFNSDSSYYGGSNLGNSGRIATDDTPCNGRPHSLSLTLPPLGGVILKRQPH